MQTTRERLVEICERGLSHELTPTGVLADVLNLALDAAAELEIREVACDTLAREIARVQGSDPERAKNLVEAAVQDQLALARRNREPVRC